MDRLPPLHPGVQKDALLQRAIRNASQHSGLSSPFPPIDPPPPTSINLKPASWTSYFDNHLTITLPSRDGRFSVYTAGTSGPVVFCLHGGGYTGLTWALIAQRLKASCRVVAPDLRAHGETVTGSDGDVSAGTMAADVTAIWQHLFGGDSDGGHKDGAEPATVLVGHSMGGALAVHVAALKGISSIAGVVVIDVVEGTALSSLPHMLTVLRRRPSQFSSLSDAIRWALASGTSHNAEAAAVSLPSQLILSSNTLKPTIANTKLDLNSTSSDGRLASVDNSGSRSGGATSSVSSLGGPASSALDVIVEDRDEDEEVLEDVIINQTLQQQRDIEQNEQDGFMRQSDGGELHRLPDVARAEKSALPLSTSSVKEVWVWRTPLEATSSYWQGWFTGLSSTFLSLSAPKVLILAGTDRLDKELMVGQMQGKFQLVVLPESGHVVHEDLPDKTAEVIAGFIKRFRIGLQGVGGGYT